MRLPVVAARGDVFQHALRARRFTVEFTEELFCQLHGPIVDQFGDGCATRSITGTSTGAVANREPHV